MNMNVCDVRCVLFDDSFEHEASNESDSPRVVLIIDIWHPDLTREEVSHLLFIHDVLTVHSYYDSEVIIL